MGGGGGPGGGRSVPVTSVLWALNVSPVSRRGTVVVSAGGGEPRASLTHRVDLCEAQLHLSYLEKGCCSTHASNCFTQDTWNINRVFSVYNISKVCTSPKTRATHGVRLFRSADTRNPFSFSYLSGNDDDLGPFRRLGQGQGRPGALSGQLDPRSRHLEGTRQVHLNGRGKIHDQDITKTETVRVSTHTCTMQKPRMCASVSSWKRPNVD